MTFPPSEANDLRIIYGLAFSALTHTHHVNEDIGPHLANAVFDTYLGWGGLRFGLSSAELEDVALESLSQFLRAYGNCLAMKRLDRM